MNGLDPAGCVALVEEMLTEGVDTVFVNGWNGHAPGYSGSIRVHKLSSAYFVASDDLPIHWPYDSLDDALDQLESPFAITSITEEIACTELSTEELVALIEWWPTDESGASLEGFPPSEWPDCDQPFLLNRERWLVRCEAGEVEFTRADARAASRETGD